MILLALPELASAQSQYFTYNYHDRADVLIGFRKTGTFAGNYEMLVNLGSVTNLIDLPANTTITISNYGPAQLTDAFTNFNNLNWSVFSCNDGYGGKTGPGTWSTPAGTYPGYTVWFTAPATNVNYPAPPPPGREIYIDQRQTPCDEIVQIGNGGAQISTQIGGVTNADNNIVLVREPSANSQTLTTGIGDALNTAVGDFGSNNNPLPNLFDVENITSNNFTAAQRSDFYQFCPLGYTDPITGSTNANPYLVGYFILNPSGTMTFTRASSVAQPSAGTVTASATNGFGPLTVVFTNTASGSITNWVWNFGNGTMITNTTGGTVTNTYATSGSYTVTLTVYGPGGSSMDTVANFVVVSAKPKLGGLTASGGKLIFSGTNGPVGVQYRILTSTNVTTLLANWTPIYTNTFGSNGSYGFTNSISTTNSYFIMVSP